MRVKTDHHRQSQFVLRVLTLLFLTSLSSFGLAMLWEKTRSKALVLLQSGLPFLSHRAIESIIITPCCLILPLTHVVGQMCYNKQGFISRPFTGGLTHVIQQGLSWMLFSVALSILIFAIFYKPGLAGLISLGEFGKSCVAARLVFPALVSPPTRSLLQLLQAAMLGLFAQAFMVSSIITFEEDVVKSSSPHSAGPTRAADGPDDLLKTRHTVAKDWVSSPKKKDKQNSDSFEDLLAKRKRRRKRDFALWCVMNYALLQSPFLFKRFYRNIIHTCKDCVSGVEHVPSFFVLAATLGIPIFTHGIGGIIFHREEWSFHHPFSGGKFHVLSQAAGWTLVCLAGLMQLLNLLLGTSFDFLLHSGNVLGWIAEALLLYSISNYEDKKTQERKRRQQPSRQKRPSSSRGPMEFVVATLQDLYMTNMHWFFIFWVGSAPFGFNIFSSRPLENVFNVTLVESALNLMLVLFICCLPSLLFPYSATRKPISLRFPFAVLIKIAETILLSPYGVYRDSMIELEDSREAYERNGCMFAIHSHGTVPLSVWALWHQRSDIFDKVCLFFGSQVALIPGYRLWAGARGGCMTITKKNLIRVMKTRQNVGLYPGGIKEMMGCEPFHKNIKLSIKHKGFIRIALQEGFDLCPILAMHENDMYNNPMRDFQFWCYKKFKVPAGLPYYTNRFYLPVSNQKPLRVVLGKRIKVKQVLQPTEAQVDQLHRLFYEEVVRCWAKHKNNFGYGDRELVYIE